MIAAGNVAWGVLRRGFHNIPNFCLFLHPMIVTCMDERKQWHFVFTVSTINVTIRAGLLTFVC